MKTERSRTSVPVSSRTRSGVRRPSTARVEEMDAQGLVPVGDRAYLARERRVAVRRIEELDRVGQRAVERAEPAEERRNPDAARDPDLPIGSLRVVEPAVRAAHDSRHAGLEEIREPRRVVAERLDRDAEAILVRSARDRERMAMPAVLRLQVDHRELARHELDLPSEGTQRDLGQPGLTSCTASTS